MSERVEVTVDHEDVENDDGRMVPGVVVTCSKCGVFTDAYGSGPRSVRRAIMKLREACDAAEDHFYDCAEAEL